MDCNNKTEIERERERQRNSNRERETEKSTYSGISEILHLTTHK